MNLSFLSVTVLYLALLLYIHHKLRLKEKPRQLKHVDMAEIKLDTIISLDDIDSDIENDTIKDLKKFLATPEIIAKENAAPIINSLDLNEYFGDDGSDDNSDHFVVDSDNFVAEIKADIDTKSQENGEVKPFDSIKAFDDFGGYENFAAF